MRKIFFVLLFLLVSQLGYAQWIPVAEKIHNFEIVGDTIVAVGTNSTSYNRILYSTDRGVSWSDYNTIPWTGNEAYDIDEPFYANGQFFFYANNSASGFFRSGDSLGQWVAIENGLPDVESGIRKQDINSAFELNGNLIAYTGTTSENRRVVMSTDWGDNWTIQSENNADYHTFTTNGKVILAAGATGVFQSTDMGQTFTQVGDYTFTSLRDFDASGDTLVATTEAVSFEIQMHVSTDFGQTWKTINVNELYGHLPGNVQILDGEVYVQSLNTTEGFMLNLEDEEVISLGKPFVERYINDFFSQQIFFTPINYEIEGDTLYATAYTGLDSRLFKRSLSTVGVANETEEEITGFTLNQNYPNPFNPATTISYSLQSAGYVSLEVFNSIGQKVSTLVDGIQTGGEHHVLFNAFDLPSGMYIYRISANGHTSTRKMTLLK